MYTAELRVEYTAAQTRHSHNVPPPGSLCMRAYACCAHADDHNTNNNTKNNNNNNNSSRILLCLQTHTPKTQLRGAGSWPSVEGLVIHVYVCIHMCVCVCVCVGRGGGGRVSLFFELVSFWSTYREPGASPKRILLP